MDFVSRPRCASIGRLLKYGTKEIEKAGPEAFRVHEHRREVLATRGVRGPRGKGVRSPGVGFGRVCEKSIDGVADQLGVLYELLSQLDGVTWPRISDVLTVKKRN